MITSSKQKNFVAEGANLNLKVNAQSGLEFAALLEQGLKYYEQSLKINDSAAQIGLEINQIYKQVVPRWHFSMLNDVERNVAFEKAISQVLEDDCTVLDVGTGTGLLAMLAARHGAKQVFSCEMVRPIALLAQQIVSANNFDDVIQIISKKSNDLLVGQDLSRKADVLVTETVDCGLVGEGIIPIIRHAREHLLVNKPSIIPAKAKVKFSLLESDVIHGLNFVSDASSFDVSLFNEFSSSGYFPVRLNTWPYRLLSEYHTALEFDFLNDSLMPQQQRRVARVKQDGICHGIVFWFELELSHDVSLVNDPGNPKSHWMQAVQCFETPLNVFQDDLVELMVIQDDSNIEFQVTNLVRAN
jgi:predicted RNA methylase